MIKQLSIPQKKKCIHVRTNRQGGNRRLRPPENQIRNRRRGGGRGNSLQPPKVSNEERSSGTGGQGSG